MIVFVHRKDLRIADMPAFTYISRKGSKSLHLFVLDPVILSERRTEAASGRHFMAMLARLQELYRREGAKLNVVYGAPEEIIPQAALLHEACEVVVHRDDTPYARQRDGKLEKTLWRLGIPLTVLSDQPLAEPDEFHRYAGRQTPYKVFTPYYRKWSEFVRDTFQPPSAVSLRQLTTASLHESLADAYRSPFRIEPLPNEESMTEPERALGAFVGSKLSDYADRRDWYATDATSGLSAYINTGAISIRTVYESMLEGETYEAWRRQLAWRDFYLYQSALDPLFFRYERHFDLSILSDRHVDAWSRAETGIPIIDAAMTQLNETGRMPNRLRMVTAMFLTKNLLAPFPFGESLFRHRLADADNVLNRGGWLWSASLGFDAAPYFRIMNPESQSRQWDPAGEYIRRWLPQLRAFSDRDIHRPLPHAIVDLKASRARAIDVYKQILSSAGAMQREVDEKEPEPGSAL
ncbi:cryptochrome/photolyase family protein [Paenibacillus hodogayensis]|uniref:Cryptochrome/photolyase family protein n=1 Tax=Paenibacillus hodogayensis TaxID=279208 RepID=A0ABV5W178_9BACL